MEGVHVQGISTIYILQKYLQGHEELMMFITKLGDPRIAFLVYFPMAYFCKCSSGIKVMWTASLAEWLNSVFKWLLFGQRPYWWVHTSGLYNTTDGSLSIDGNLQQYRLTCETGPGSPSGHVMVTGAVWYVMISELAQVYGGSQRKWFDSLSWLFYMALIGSIGLSRCFISAHFPHQILGGIIAGLVVGICCSKINPEEKGIFTYITVSTGQLAVGAVVYGALWLFGINAMWTLPLAQKWCMKRGWVHLDTTPFMCYVRDAAALLGTGVTLYYIQSRSIRKSNGESQRRNGGLAFKLTGITLAILVTQCSEMLNLPQDPVWRFYSLAFIKWLLLPWIIIVVIGKICEVIFSFGSKVKNGE